MSSPGNGRGPDGAGGGEGRDARADDDAMTVKRVDEKSEETVRLTTD